MLWQQTPYTLPLLAITVVGAVTTWYAWLRFDGEGRLGFSGTMFFLSTWSLFVCLTVTAVPFWLKLLSYYLVIMSGFFAGVAWYVFAAGYTGRERALSRPVVALVAAMAALFIAMLATNRWHELALLDPRLDEAGSYVRLRYEWGVGLWSALVSMWSLLLLSTYFLFVKFLRSRNVYRKIAFVQVVGGLTILAASVYTVTGLSPLPHLMAVPVVFGGIAGVTLLILYSVTFVRLVPLEKLLSPLGDRFGNLLPLARDVVIEEIDAGVVVLDADDRIVDVNETGKELIASDRRVIGKRFAAVTDDSALLDVDALAETDRRRGSWVDTPHGEQYYELSVTRISDDSGAGGTGRVVLMHDATDRKRREEELDLLKDVMSRFLRHNIRNELNVVQGHLEIIADDVSAHEDRIELLLETTDKIIDHSSKSRAIEQVVETDDETVSVDLGHVASGVVARARDQYPDAEITLSTPDSARASCSSNVDLAIENAVENAVEHTEKPSPRIDVDVETDRNDVTVRISDDGPGIGDEEIEVLRNEAETALQHGSGFGLWLMNIVVQNSGGDLEFSTERDGTTVTVRFPRERTVEE